VPEDFVVEVGELVASRFRLEEMEEDAIASAEAGGPEPSSDGFGEGGYDEDGMFVARRGEVPERILERRVVTPDNGSDDEVFMPASEERLVVESDDELGASRVL
jgi:hypothetical protein